SGAFGSACGGDRRARRDVVQPALLSGLQSSRQGARRLAGDAARPGVPAREGGSRGRRPAPPRGARGRRDPAHAPGRSGWNRGDDACGDAPPRSRAARRLRTVRAELERARAPAGRRIRSVHPRIPRGAAPCRRRAGLAPRDSRSASGSARSPGMTIHVHHLTGCSPTPLAHYLKGLGVLRLVAEQKDPAARGWWRDEAFHLATTLDEEALQRFFLAEYVPTPLVGPWGARSGFFSGSEESAARSALERIEATTDERLAPYRDAIRQVREILAELGLREKAEKDEDKLRLIRVLRQRLPENIVRWIDVCVVLTDDWRSYPALLGTGGNEGSGSYFSNFSQSIVSCLIDKKHDADLKGALYAGAYQGSRKGPAPGHFFPIAASPPNGSTGFWGAVEMNPWDLILCLEGAIVFVASVARRLHATELPQAAAPFAVRSSAVGYGSAAEGEEDRGEQWFPLWERPATLTEIRGLFG